ncbi:MAG: PIG-L family deacetylase [Actinobacteria bacterium]|nr:MAG: PIG-L family deacetylase [Actinomycetota bacterium]
MLRLVKQILIVAGVALAVLGIVVILLAYAAFPVMQYLSRVQDPVAAKRRGEVLDRVTGRTVLAVVAHPDDAEAYAGGLLAKLAGQDNRVVLVVGTSGEKGGNGVPELARVREAEQRTAGSIIGYDRIVFARQPDRGLEDGPRFRELLREVFEEESPRLLVTFDAERQAFGYRHSDHIAAGAASLAVARDFPGVGAAYLFSSSSPDVLVDIGPFIDLKIRGRSAHESQSQGSSLIRRILALLRRLPGAFRPEGRSRFNTPYRQVGIEYSESYRLVELGRPG